MPLRSIEPFKNPLDGKKKAINPYLEHFLSEDQVPIFYGPTLDRAGQWRGCFPGAAKPQKLVLEIGCHFGKTLTEVAQDNPDMGFLGCDITFKRIVKTARKAGSLGLTNVALTMFNAAGIHQVFAPGELDGVVLFFPDPWQKKRTQEKKRLFNLAFGEHLQRCLASDGFLWFKTDAKHYFDQVTQICEQDLGLTPDDTLPFGRDYGSNFGELFSSQAIPHYSQVWRKKT